MPTPQLAFNAGLLLSLAAIFIAPLFIFTPIMMTTWRRAAEYGALAEQMGIAFEDKWLGRDRRLDHTALDQPDFSSTTDLYQVVANIYAMRLIPIDFTSVAMFGVAMLLPFVPVTLLIVPLDKVLAGLKSFCFDLIDALPTRCPPG